MAASIILKKPSQVLAIIDRLHEHYGIDCGELPIISKGTTTLTQNGGKHIPMWVLREVLLHFNIKRLRFASFGLKLRYHMIPDYLLEIIENRATRADGELTKIRLTVGHVKNHANFYCFPPEVKTNINGMKIEVYNSLFGLGGIGGTLQATTPGLDLTAHADDSDDEGISTYIWFASFHNFVLTIFFI